MADLWLKRRAVLCRHIRRIGDDKVVQDGRWRHESLRRDVDYRYARRDVGAQQRRVLSRQRHGFLAAEREKRFLLASCHDVSSQYMSL